MLILVKLIDVFAFSQFELKWNCVVSSLQDIVLSCRWDPGSGVLLSANWCCHFCKLLLNQKKKNFSVIGLLCIQRY